MSMLFDVYLVHIASDQRQYSFFVLLPEGKGMGIDDIYSLESQFIKRRNDLGYLVNFNKLTDEITAKEIDMCKLLSFGELRRIRGNDEQP